jgi:RHS repeat-associated protein
VTGNTVGQTQTFTVAAMDATGHPVTNLPVTLAIAGANGSGVLGSTTQVKGTTDSAGLARFSYVGLKAGTDTALATASVMGLQALSNAVSVPWSLSSTPTGGTAPAPAITSPSPPDGTTVTKPVPISATFAPPAGQSITSFKVTYQGQSGSGPVTLASGSGTPPATLGVLDPTLLLNDTYLLTISATASGGGTQVLTTSVIVAGRLKLGRYVTTYQDLSVPVGGFQMEVRRVYDTVDKRAGDFGIGWHVELANFRVSTNRQLGAGGWTQYNSFCGIGLCLTAFKTSSPHFVTVVFPDGHEEVFDFTPTGGTNVFLGGGAAFTARPGTTSTLQAVGDTSLTYTFDGNLYGSTGPPYNATRFTLTTRDRRVLILDTAAGLISETDASGNAITVDSAGVHSTLGPATSPTPGPSITFTRDTQGRITDINGPVPGQHYHYAYLTSANELQAVIDPMGNTRSYTYDPQTGELQKVLDPNNQPLQTLTYDATGRLVSIANGSQPATTIATNVGTQQQVILDPNGKLTTVLNYDALGDVTERDDTFNGRTLKTTYAFDAQGRTLSVTDPLQNTTSLQYDQNTGNLLSVSSAGRSWSFENYNSFSEPGLIRNPDGSIQLTYTYDATTGAVLTEQQPGANPTTFAYLPSGQLKSVTDPGGRTVGYTYDANGHLATIADSLGRTIRVGIDSAGRVQSVTDQIGNQSLFDYNPDGTLSRITDARKNQWLYSYDALGRVKQLIDPLQHSASYLYNDLGQVQQVTDRNAQITTYGYDVDGLLTKETRPGNDVVNLTYDPLGHLIETDNASSHVDRSYDDASRLVSETTCANTGASATACTSAAAGNQPTVGVSYSYFPDSQLKSVTSSDPATPAVQYTYDNFGRLASIKTGSQAPFTFSYDALGRLSTLSRPNGITDSLRYDASGGLTNRDASLNGTTVARFDYSIEPSTGRRLSMTDNAGTSNYAYYDNGTLQSASHPAGTGVANEAYTDDAAGNRSSVGRASTYDTANRLQSDGSNSYAFDAEGNLTSKTPTTGGTGTTYTWNASHQLTKIAYPDGTSSSYRYDPFGRRIAAVDKGQETRFVYDGVDVKADYNSANQLQTSYLSHLESTTSAGQPSFYLEDGLGSVRALSDSSGTITGTYSYNSFGVPSATNPSQSRHTFGGHQYDSASGLYDAGARYYDPTAGRFISEDPVASANAYPFAGNDPINQVDVYGMQAAAEYATLLQTDANNAQCIAGIVASIAGPAITGAIFGLGGYAVNAEDVLATIQFGLLINAAACAAGQASRGTACGAAAATLVIYVIGRTPDVDPYRGVAGYRTFEPAGQYNWAANEAWLQEALRGRNPIVVVSALTPENMRSARYGLTGFGREMRYLWNSGVRPSARIPPGSVICP